MFAVATGAIASRNRNPTFSGSEANVPFFLRGDGTTFRSERLVLVPLTLQGSSTSFRTDTVVAAPITMFAQSTSFRTDAVPTAAITLQGSSTSFIAAPSTVPITLSA